MPPYVIHVFRVIREDSGNRVWVFAGKDMVTWGSSRESLDNLARRHLHDFSRCSAKIAIHKTIFSEKSAFKLIDSVIEKEVHENQATHS